MEIEHFCKAWSFNNQHFSIEINNHKMPLQPPKQVFMENQKILILWYKENDVQTSPLALLPPLVIFNPCKPLKMGHKRREMEIFYCHTFFGSNYT